MIDGEEDKDMCGRYYIDDETSREIEKLVQDIDKRLKIEYQMDIFPSESAVVITQREDMLVANRMKWGFPRYKSNNLIINARAESIEEREIFRDSMLYRRCVIPAKGFYEWNTNKEKFCFESENIASTLWMAGCYKFMENEPCFVIITIEANAFVRPVHTRMPLILTNGEIWSWIYDTKAARELLLKDGPELKRTTSYEQLVLF